MFLYFPAVSLTTVMFYFIRRSRLAAAASWKTNYVSKQSWMPEFPTQSLVVSDQAQRIYHVLLGRILIMERKSKLAAFSCQASKTTQRPLCFYFALLYKHEWKKPH